MTGPCSPALQYGALCWRNVHVPEVLMITSRETGRWIIPKGWPMDGRSPCEAAEIEAWEEAGVKGHISPVLLGSVASIKRHASRGDIRGIMEVYALQVECLAGKYPERKQRKRAWMTLEEAASRVREPDLAKVLRNFDPSILFERHLPI